MLLHPGLVALLLLLVKHDAHKSRRGRRIVEEPAISGPDDAGKIMALELRSDAVCYVLYAALTCTRRFV